MVDFENRCEDIEMFELGYLSEVGNMDDKGDVSNFEFYHKDAKNAEVLKAV
jgi:hypothetical protein